jgi:amino acid transporter
MRNKYYYLIVVSFLIFLVTFFSRYILLRDLAGLNLLLPVLLTIIFLISLKTSESWQEMKKIKQSFIKYTWIIIVLLTYVSFFYIALDKFPPLSTILGWPTGEKQMKFVILIIIGQLLFIYLLLRWADNNFPKAFENGGLLWKSEKRNEK